MAEDYCFFGKVIYLCPWKFLTFLMGVAWLSDTFCVFFMRLLGKIGSFSYLGFWVLAFFLFWFCICSAWVIDLMTSLSGFLGFFFLCHLVSAEENPWSLFLWFLHSFFTVIYSSCLDRMFFAIWKEKMFLCVSNCWNLLNYFFFSFFWFCFFGRL